MRNSKFAGVCTNPGHYFLWVEENEANKQLSKLSTAKFNLRKMKINGGDYVCVYVGIASSLKERLKWHICQSHTPASIKSGRISTLRKTISALLGINLSASEGSVNDWLDEYCYFEWGSNGTKEEAEIIEDNHLSKTGGVQYPLNIVHNNTVSKGIRDKLKKLRNAINK